MVKKILYSLDSKPMCLLSEDGWMVGRLEVNPPTVRSRIRSFMETGMLKINGLIEPLNHQGLTTATIGLNIISHGKLYEILQQKYRQ